MSSDPSSINESKTFRREKVQLETLRDRKKEIPVAQDIVQVVISKVVSKDNQRARTANFEAAKKAKADGLLSQHISTEVTKSGASIAATILRGRLV